MADYCISRKLSFEVADKPGYFRTYYPRWKDDDFQKETILSVQPNGDKGTRLVDEGGAWETWYPSKDGNRAIFDETAEPYAFPLVD